MKVVNDSFNYNFIIKYGENWLQFMRNKMTRLINSLLWMIANLILGKFKYENGTTSTATIVTTLGFKHNK